MKTVMMMAGLVMAAGTASAQLIAADSYDGYTLTGLNGQNPVVTPGWTGAGSTGWVVGSANLQGDSISLTNSATAYDDASTGKGKYIASSFDFYRAGHRKTDNFAGSNTYFMSFFVNPGGAFTNTTGRNHAMVGFTNFFNESAFAGTNTDNVYGLMAGFRGETVGAAAGQKDLVLRAQGLGGTMQDTVLLSNVVDTTYHVIYKLEVDVNGNGDDRVTWWVNASSLATEGQLTSTAVATGSILTQSMDTQTSLDRSFVLTRRWSASFFWDETRLGYDLQSVTGIPTPGALALIGLGGLAASRRRRG
jgi:MYXO-CTERM domain-containing protein